MTIQTQAIRTPKAIQTPGPWFAFQTNVGFWDITCRNDWASPSIATVHQNQYLPSGDAGANARLLAAAPDLLDALQEAAEFIEDQVDVVDGSYGEPAPNKAMSLMTVIEAALRKAGAAS